MLFIKETNIPLIFYNGYRDILHIQEKFYNGLPYLYNEFNNEVINNFGTFYDQKVIF